MSKKYLVFRSDDVKILPIFVLLYEMWLMLVFLIFVF